MIYGTTYTATRPDMDGRRKDTALSFYTKRANIPELHRRGVDPPKGQSLDNRNLEAVSMACTADYP